MQFGVIQKEKQTVNYKRKTREIVLVFGKTGHGKTLWTRQYIKGLKRVIILDPLYEYDSAKQFDNLSDLVSHIRKYPIFRVSHGNVNNLPLLCDIATCIDGAALVIEEAQRVLPSRLTMPEEFEDIIYRGRHTGTSVILVAQRASTVNIAVRSQFNRMITFRQTEPKDVKWIEDASGYDIAQAITELDVFDYFEITPKGYEKKRLTV